VAEGEKRKLDAVLVADLCLHPPSMRGPYEVVDSGL
jgi:hypothetical protein